MGEGGGAEGEIREALIKEDLVEAVIGLPPNLFFGTGIPAVILVINNGKAEDRLRRILFVDASREYAEKGAKNWLRDEDIPRVALAIRNLSQIDSYSRVISLDEIGRSHYSLNVNRYIAHAGPAGDLEVGIAILRLREAEADRDIAQVKMERLLAELGYGR